VYYINRQNKNGCEGLEDFTAGFPVSNPKATSSAEGLFITREPFARSYRHGEQGAATIGINERYNRFDI
jgi:hypothetical protein